MKKLIFILIVINIYLFIFFVTNISGENQNITSEISTTTKIEENNQSITEELDTFFPEELDSTTTSNPLPPYGTHQTTEKKLENTPSPPDTSSSSQTTSPSTQTLPPSYSTAQTTPPVSTVNTETIPPPTTTPTTPQTPAPPVVGNLADEILEVSKGKGRAIEIIARVVAGEVYPSYNDEAIKAHIVAIYTDIKQSNARGQVKSYGYINGEIPSNIQRLVNDFFAQPEAIYYNGKLIEAIFCAASAGNTLSGSEVWGGNLPYLIGKSTPFDGDKVSNSALPNSQGMKKEMTSSQVKKLISGSSNITLSGNPANWFKINSHIRNTKYVNKITINGSKTSVVSGREFREKVLINSNGGMELRSAAFEISYNKTTDKFTFTTYGYGHGAGMSGEGSHILAENKGYSYKEILRFYYSGITIEKVKSLNT